MIGDTKSERRRRRSQHPIIGPVIYHINKAGRIDKDVVNRAIFTRDQRRIVNAALTNLQHSHPEGYQDKAWTGSLIKRIERAIVYGC